MYISCHTFSSDFAKKIDVRRFTYGPIMVHAQQSCIIARKNTYYIFLPFAEKGDITLDQCLSLFTEPEVLSPEYTWWEPPIYLWLLFVLKLSWLCAGIVQNARSTEKPPNSFPSGVCLIPSSFNSSDFPLGISCGGIRLTRKWISLSGAAPLLI